MENEFTGLNHQARSYFLHQGQSVNRLYGLLSSNLLIHHLSKWFSVLLELCLYITSMVLIVSAICLPTDITYYVPIPFRGLKIDFHDPDFFDVNIYNRNFTYLIYIVKLFIAFVTIPFFMFARLLARNRKKSALIREAFLEVEKMKDDFNEALGDLKL